MPLVFVSRSPVTKVIGQWHQPIAALALKSLLSVFFFQRKENKGWEVMHFIAEHIARCRSAFPSLFHPSLDKGSVGNYFLKMLEAVLWMEALLGFCYPGGFAALPLSFFTRSSLWRKACASSSILNICRES